MPKPRAAPPPPAEEARLRQLLAHLPVGVYRTTPDGRLLEANPALATMLGFPLEELGSIDIRSFYLDDAERRAHLSGLQATPVLFREFPLRTRDGRVIWVRDHPIAIPGGSDGIAYIDGILVDVTELHAAEAALRQSEQDHRQLFEQAQDAILLLSEDGATVLDANPRACELFGYRREELAGTPFARLSAGRLERHPPARGGRGRARSFEAILQRAGGERITLEIVAAPATFRGAPAILSVQRDITERLKLQEVIREMASKDPLTGLPNRTLLSDRLQLAIIHARRRGTAVALLFLDLDGFKAVNDRLGHGAGDQLLRAVAGRLRDLVRQGDTVARLGGDEFLVLLPDIGSRADAARMAAKLQRAVAAPYPLGRHRARVGTSLGMALFPEDGDSAEALLRRADAEMYRDKAARKAAPD